MTRSTAALALVMFLALVPVTLPVPGLSELVMVAHGGTEGEAHAFMSINMLGGMIAVPFVMRALPRISSVRAAIMLALLLDAVAFVGMANARGIPSLMVFRLLDGVAHLPAVTLIMVASNRLSGARRGATLGALASAIMIGVAVGSPLGGWLVGLGPQVVYLTGAAILGAAALVAGTIGDVPRVATPRPRYAWNRQLRVTWVPLGYAFMDRFSIGIFVSTFTLYLATVVGVSAAERGILIALFMVPFALLCYPVGRLADRHGWFVPMLAGNVLFGLVFAAYGVTPREWLPAAMVASGIFSAFMFAPNLLLISDLAKRGAGEGLFGAFQLAGSFGFLLGPLVGGALVSLTRGADGVPAYRSILLAVGILEIAFAGVSFVMLRQLAAEERGIHVAGASASVQG